MTDVICRELKTKARTRTRDDGKTYEHAVTLRLRAPDYNRFASRELADRYAYKWLLVIEDTPGQWYVSTLLGAGWAELAGADSPARKTRPSMPASRVAIDYGQGWFCENFDEVFAEALGLI